MGDGAGENIERPFPNRCFFFFPLTLPPAPKATLVLACWLHSALMVQTAAA